MTTKHGSNEERPERVTMLLLWDKLDKIEQRLLSRIDAIDAQYDGKFTSLQASDRRLGWWAVILSSVAAVAGTIAAIMIK